MKFFNLLAFASVVSANAISDAAGQIFIGMMSATQSNMYNKESDCYVSAEDVAVTLNDLIDNQDTSLV